MALQSEDLGNGFSLVYQTGNSQFRAVVKDATGTIVARGPVVPERQIGASKFAAVQEWMSTQTQFAEPEEKPDLSEDTEDFEEDDEESEEDEFL